MNILWLSHLIPYPPKGGVLQRSYYLLRELARYHTVDLLAFNQKDLITPLFVDYHSGLREARHELEGFCRRVEFVDIECDKHRFGRYSLALLSLISEDPYNINWLKSKPYRRILESWSQAVDYNVVHFDTISLVPYLDLFPNTPKILDHHNIESHMLLRRAENERNFLKHYYYKQEGRRLQNVEKNYCPQFSFNITCSDIDRDRLNRVSPESRVVSVTNGVDVDFFRGGNAHEIPNTLVFVGTLSWYPNADAVKFIVENLWDELTRRIPGISIDIVGSNPPPAALKAASMYKNFRVHGYVDDVRPYIDRAALYICPIRDGGGTKLKLLDAFAMSKTVVANPIACEGIEAQPGRDIVFAATPEEYIRQVDSLLSNRDRRLEIGSNARQLAERRYSYASIGKELSRVFERAERIDG